MPRATSVKQYNTFVKGLITEASPLTYPENASLDEDNFVLKRDGSRERRLGVDYENGYALTATGLAATIIEGSRQSFHKWENPGGDTSVSIGVIRVANKLWFIDLLTDAPSNNLLNNGAALTITGLSSAEIETSVINNYFIIVSADLGRPILLQYDKETQTIQQSVVHIQVRDLWGVADGLGITERPTTLSKVHEYNLYNQGWVHSIQTSCDTSAETKSAFALGFMELTLANLGVPPAPEAEFIDPIVYTTIPSIQCTYTNQGYFPSNADIWTLGKVGDSTSANFEKYDPATMVRNAVDGIEAPKGHLVLDAFYRGYSRNLLLGSTNLPQDKEEGKLTTIAAYSGRVFYSGVVSSIIEADIKSPNFSNYIFFSQVVTSADRLGKCYQEADPTSPNISDIIDTDGGAIQIPEATRIYKLIPTSTSLLAFAENGIWEIFGDTNGFVATSYQVSKISSTGFSSPKSVVEAIGTVFAWTKAGIYIVSVDKVSGRYQAENISLVTIQTLYNELTELTKNNARGFYDEKENKVRWLYNDTPAYLHTSYVNKYNRELILDLTLQSFYTQSISNSIPYVADYIALPNYVVVGTEEDVYAGNEPVIDLTLAQVVVDNDAVFGRITPFSFLTMAGTSFTISQYNNDSFIDWKTYDGVGVNYSSYLLTGYETFGDIVRTKQVPYIWFYFRKTEDGFSLDGSGNLQIDHPSSCRVKAKWNWTDSAASGQWGSSFQAYKFKRSYIPSGEFDSFDNGYEVIVTKNKLRGSGRSLSMLIESEEGKDMRLLGWSVIVSAEGTP